ncbi:MAG: TolC family protein [Lachnospiraceae bacterium]|nr:TolC family protein [Lachnospiraceae bacterium]
MRLKGKLTAVLLCLSIIFSALPPVRVHAAGKKLTLSLCRSLALEHSKERDSAELGVIQKTAKRESALKALKLTKKNLSTFRWMPLLSFKFPQSTNFAQESKFQFQPLSLANDILVAQHKLQDIVFSVDEAVNNLFVEIVTLQKTLDFNQKRLDSYSDSLKHNQAKVKRGEANQSDVDRLQKKVDTLNNSIASDRRTLEADLKKLSDMIGMDVTTGYTFETPYVEAKINRENLDALMQYTEDRDETYYEACMKATSARIELQTNYGIMNSKYGSDMNLISMFINSALNKQEVSKTAFYQKYKEFLDKIDSYWNKSFKILFIKISFEFLKGELDGTRYVADDPYTLYNNVLDYIQAFKDEDGAKKDLDSQVTDAFNNYISVRSSYESYSKDVEEQGKKLDEYAVKNKMGEMTFEEYQDEVDNYEEIQNSMLDSMKLYTTTLYSFDRLTCGGVSALLSGTDADMQTAVVGESFVEKSTDKAMYYLKSIIQKEMFELSLFIPEDFDIEITDFELWCDGQLIGQRTPVTGSLRHLKLTNENINKAFIRLYNGENFVDDCIINPNEESGELNIVTANNVNKIESGEIGSYETSVSDVTGLASLGITPLESEKVAAFRILAEDGTPLGDGSNTPVSKKFTHLSLVPNDLELLSIECYDENGGLMYTGYFDTANQKIRKKETGE